MLQNIAPWIFLVSFNIKNVDSDILCSLPALSVLSLILYVFCFICRARMSGMSVYYTLFTSALAALASAAPLTTSDSHDSSARVPLRMPGVRPQKVGLGTSKKCI